MPATSLPCAWFSGVGKGPPGFPAVVVRCGRVDDKNGRSISPATSFFCAGFSGVGGGPPGFPAVVVRGRKTSWDAGCVWSGCPLRVTNGIKEDMQPNR